MTKTSSVLQFFFHFMFLFGYFPVIIVIHLPSIVKGQTSLYRGYHGSNKDKDGGLIDDVPLTVKLSNEISMPLVGLGVGNLQRNLVETMIHHGLSDDRRIRLIDTSHESGNEREVSRGITTGIKDLKEKLTSLSPNNNDNNKHHHNNKERIQVHVVTKIWYTYLGYSRTKLAVEEILQSFEEAIKDPSVDFKIHILIHWAACYDHIPWMNCKEEEEQLPDRVKRTGPPPHLDKNAWKESWRALEEIYDSNHSVDTNKDEYHSVIAGIGISNFDYRTLSTLLQTAKITPHLIQISVWTILNDPTIVKLLNDNNIHIQAYNIMNGILGRIHNNPKAHHHILMIANQLEQKSIHSSSMTDSIVETIYSSQVVLKWLVQFGISMVCRTSNLDRLSENSAVSISKIPTLNEQEMDVVSKSMVALINNEDLKDDVSVQVRFHAKESDMFLYFVSEEDNEKQLAFIEQGSSYSHNSHPGHKFKVYHAYDPDQFEIFSIHGHYGETQDIHVEL